MTASKCWIPEKKQLNNFFLYIYMSQPNKLLRSTMNEASCKMSPPSKPLRSSMNETNCKELLSDLRTICGYLKQEKGTHSSACPDLLRRKFIYNNIKSTAESVNDKWVKYFIPSSVDQIQANSAIQDFNTKIDIFVDSGWDYIPNTSQGEQLYKSIQKLKGIALTSTKSPKKPKIYNEWQDFNPYDLTL